MAVSFFQRAGIAAAAVALVFLAAGCAESAPQAAPDASSQEDASTKSDPSTNGGDTKPGDPAQGGSGDYAFGADRDQIAEAIESAFSTSNGKARWDGDLLILAVDGDAKKTMAGFTQCQVLSHLLAEGDESAIEFPNGRISCAEVLATD